MCEIIIILRFFQVYVLDSHRVELLNECHSKIQNLKWIPSSRDKRTKASTKCMQEGHLLYVGLVHQNNSFHFQIFDNNGLKGGGSSQNKSFKHKLESSTKGFKLVHQNLVDWTVITKIITWKFNRKNKIIFCIL